MLYERIEEKGIDYVLRKYSQRQRDDYLKQTEAEELVMYSIIGLTPQELKKLFTPAVLQKEFSRLPPENLFYCFDSLQNLLNSRVFLKLFQQIDIHTFLSEYRKTPGVLFQLLDNSLIKRSDILDKLQNLSLHSISSLRKYHSRFEEVWSILCEMIGYSIFPIRSGTSWKGVSCHRVKEAAKRAYSRDIAKYIITFL